MHILISHRHGAATISFKRNELEVIDVVGEGGMMGGSEFVEGDAAC
jgi:hypothetical protein